MLCSHLVSLVRNCPRVRAMPRIFSRWSFSRLRLLHARGCAARSQKKPVVVPSPFRPFTCGQVSKREQGKYPSASKYPNAGKYEGSSGWNAPTVIVPILSDCEFPDYRSDDVLTQRNDNNRTGTSHVTGIDQDTVDHFKRLGSFPVNGVVLSQPLYAHSAMVDNVRQPVLIVATSTNDVYAFSPSEHRTQPLWHTSLGRPVVSKDPPSGAREGTRSSRGRC